MMSLSYPSGVSDLLIKKFRFVGFCHDVKLFVLFIKLCTCHLFTSFRNLYYFKMRQMIKRREIKINSYRYFDTTEVLTELFLSIISFSPRVLCPHTSFSLALIVNKLTLTALPKPQDSECLLWPPSIMERVARTRMVPFKKEKKKGKGYSNLDDT